jgi:transposase-like protein
MAETKKKRGRRPDASSKSGQIRELLKTGMSASDIAKKLDCTPALVYNVKARVSGKSGGARRGRPSGRVSSGLDGLSGILDAVKNGERERAQLRGTLERIQAVIAEALA